MDLLTSQISRNGSKTTLFDEILHRLTSIKMKIKIRFEELQGIGDTITDIQSSTCELLISMLIGYPEIFEMFEQTGQNQNKAVVEAILSTIRHQAYDSLVVDSGLRFIALYAKHDPETCQKVLIENQASDSFLKLVESVTDPEVIANGLAIIAA